MDRNNEYTYKSPLLDSPERYRLPIEMLMKNQNLIDQNLISYHLKMSIFYYSRKGSDTFSNGGFLLPPLDIGYQCSMRFLFWIRNIKIRTAVLFIPDEILTPKFKEPVMNHSVVMSPN